MAGEVFGNLSALLLEWHDLEKASAYAQQEIELAKSGHMLLGLVDGYLKQAAVSTAQGCEEAARRALDFAVETATPLRSEPLHAKVAMHQANLELCCENLTAAAAWAADYIRCHHNRPMLTPLEAQSADLLLARIWLAQRRVPEVLELLDKIMPTFETGGHLRHLTEFFVLRSVAYAAQGQEAMAKESFIQALELGKPEGYVHVFFIENGPELIPLLHQVRYRFPDYVTRLLNNFSTGANPAIPLPDFLTEREQEIMDLIALGYTNRQIADELFISVGTVKGHINHILSKLNVSNRTQALLRARELNLIS